jgi:hypothetical protein
MNMKKLGLTSAVMFALCVLLGASVFAQEFSADIVTTGREGSFRGRINTAKDKIRMEQQGSIVISRLDRNVTWILMPGEKMYMEQKLEPRNIAGVMNEVPGQVERESLGEEMIDGRMTNKYRVTYNQGGESAVMFVWTTKDSNIPVKTMAEDGSWSMEYKNLKEGPQSADLFEIPAGYEKMSFDMPALPDMGY